MRSVARLLRRISLAVENEASVLRLIDGEASTGYISFPLATREAAAVVLSLGCRGRKRETERETDTDIQSDRDIHTDRHIQTDRERAGLRETDRDRAASLTDGRERQTDKQRHADRQR